MLCIGKIIFNAEFVVEPLNALSAKPVLKLGLYVSFVVWLEVLRKHAFQPEVFQDLDLRYWFADSEISWSFKQAI